ncbi:MAG TPA: hypothetical protein VMT57_04965 [Candidatus Thermoplasmatota archaeon]|nr:hypothetical protein [Candidatus Thermoplasmatota archaeon]
MDELTTISTIVATASIIIGVIFTLLELRHFHRTRKTEIIMKIYDRFSSKEMIEAMNKVGAIQFDNFEEYRKKYGFTEVAEIAVLFEGLGVLLEQNLIDIDLVNDLFGPTLDLLWERMQPVIVSMRKGLNQPYFFSHYEYLVDSLNAYRKKFS